MLGTYVLRDNLLLATPPPHPSEAPIVNPNPLATTIAPPSAGTKISIAIITPKHSSQQKLIRSETPVSEASATSSSHHEHQSSRDSHNGSMFRANGMGDTERSHAPVFGQSNLALTLVNGKEPKDSSKRKKPKNNIVKSNSSFVSRVIPHEGLTKRLQEHTPDGAFAFVNVNRAFQWLDLSSPTKVSCVRSFVAEYSGQLSGFLGAFQLAIIRDEETSTFRCFVSTPGTRSVLKPEPIREEELGTSRSSVKISGFLGTFKHALNRKKDLSILPSRS